MFKVQDETGRDIYIKDEVTYTESSDDMFAEGETVEEVGVVIGFPCAGIVQVQPTDGPPVDVMPSQLTVVSSLVQDTLELGNDADLQKVLLDAEYRYNESVKAGTAGKKKPVGSKAKKKTVEIDLEF